MATTTSKTTKTETRRKANDQIDTAIQCYLKSAKTGKDPEQILCDISNAIGYLKNAENEWRRYID